MPRQRQKDPASLGSLALTSWERAEHVTSKRKVGGASVQELASFSYSYWLGLTCLLQSRPCPPSVIGRFKQLLNNVLESDDMLGFVETCSAFRSALVQNGRWDGIFLKIPFKSRWVSPLRKALENAIPWRDCVHPSPLFDAMATFLGWLKRLPICIRQQQIAVDAYYENDRRLSSILFDDNVYVPQLEAIWFEWLEAFELREPFLPRHGSGSTADAGRIRSHKWANTGWDTAARVCLHYPDLAKVLDWPASPRLRVAQVVFVPKQAGKDRTICMEPAWLQFLQQGVAGQLVDYIHWHRQLSGYIDLYSQDVNRELCSLACQEGYATIDLSDASDCVSYRLIRRLARRLPLLRYLHATRSRTTLIDGRRISFDKFAPMGSALCFPMECILFASIVELAFRIRNGEASKGHLSGCSVYGDDIICPSEIYYLVVDILQTLGFIVNHEKSYSSGLYYESCGYEYHNGVRIQSIRHPRAHLLPKEAVSPEHVGLVTDMANTLLSHGYTDARRTLLVTYQKCRVRLGRRVIPFMDLITFDEEHLVPIGVPYCQKVWNSDLQVSGVWDRFIFSHPRKSSFDYIEHQYSTKVSPRPARKLGFRSLRPDPKWSEKGLISLIKFRQWDLIEKGEVEDVGVCRTGRLRYGIRKRFRTP